MLGALFGVLNQLLLGSLVQLGGGAARTRARQRTDGDFLAFSRGFLSHQNFGRGPHHLKVAQIVVIHVGRGVEHAQSAVKRQRRLGKPLVQTLAHLHLHKVARFNQLFGAGHGGQVVVFGKFALHLVRGALVNGRSLHRQAQAIF